MKSARRADSAKQWAAVAEGRINAETRAWLAGVAKALVESDMEKDGNRRRAQIVQAVGLIGSARNKAAEEETIRWVCGLGDDELRRHLDASEDDTEHYRRQGGGAQMLRHLQRCVVVKLLDLPEHDLNDGAAKARLNKRIKRACIATK